MEKPRSKKTTLMELVAYVILTIAYKLTSDSKKIFRWCRYTKIDSCQNCTWKSNCKRKKRRYDLKVQRALAFVAIVMVLTTMGVSTIGGASENKGVIQAAVNSTSKVEPVAEVTNALPIIETAVEKDYYEGAKITYLTYETYEVIEKPIVTPVTTPDTEVEILEEEPEVEVAEEQEVMTVERPITNEVELFIQVLHCEGGITSIEELYRIGSVIINRMNHPAYPNTLYEVIYQRGQYGCISKLFTETPAQRVIDVALDIWYNGTNVFPEDVIFQTGNEPAEGTYGRMEYVSEWHYFFTSKYW